MHHVVRLIIAIFVTYAALVLISANVWTIGEEYRVYWLLDSLNLGIHELGHFLFMPARSMVDGKWGEILVFLGGSITQWGVPFVVSVCLLIAHRYFDAGVIFLWFAQSLHSSYLYIADAVEMDIPLFGNGVLHDWHEILGRLGRLDQAVQIAEAVLLTSRICAVVSVVVVWIVFIVCVIMRMRMIRSHSKKCVPEGCSVKAK